MGKDAKEEEQMNWAVEKIWLKEATGRWSLLCGSIMVDFHTLLYKVH